jgi:hypothetical protein
MYYGNTIARMVNDCHAALVLLNYAPHMQLARQEKDKYLLEGTSRCLLLGVVHRCHPAKEYQCYTESVSSKRELLYAQS